MKSLLPFALMLAVCAPAMAGVRYTMHLQIDDGAKHTEIIQDSWLQAGRAKLLFDEGVNAQSEVDADHFGAVAYTVEGANHHATRLEKHSARGPVRIENLVTTKISQESGPIVLGHPTTHYQFTSKFDYYENGGLLKGSMTHELWVANDLGEPGLMNWMMFEYRLREDRGLESIFRQVSTLGGGLPVAYDGIARISDDDGNMRVVRVGGQVESLEIVNIDPSVFSATNSYDVVANPPSQ